MEESRKKESKKGWLLDKIYFFTPVVVTAMYFAISNYYGINMMDSVNFISLLSASISGISVIIGLFGVLLTNLISIRNESDMVQYFFRSVDKQYFGKTIRECITSGFLNLIVAAVLILNDVILPKLCYVLLYIWIYTAALFVIRSYRLISILVLLIINDDKNYEGKKDNQTVTGEEEEQLKSSMKRISTKRP